MARTESDKRKSGGLQVAEPSAPSPASDPQPESLDKVRDILFGGQMRAVENRLQGIEERFRQEHESLRSDFARQVESLDGFIRSEVQTLNERLAAERVKRAEELKVLSAEIKEAIRALEKRHVKLEESANLADAALRDQLLMMGEQLTSELSRSHQALDSAKTDRTALAGLLTDIAARLSGAPASAPGKNGPRS
jgi:DNA repair exonuclease SbcCD ATPase subunit